MCRFGQSASVQIAINRCIQWLDHASIVNTGDGYRQKRTIVLLFRQVAMKGDGRNALFCTVIPPPNRRSLAIRDCMGPKPILMLREKVHHNLPNGKVYELETWYTVGA